MGASRIALFAVTSVLFFALGRAQQPATQVGAFSFSPSTSTVLNAGSVAEVPIVTDVTPKRGVRAGGQVVTVSGARMAYSPKATCMFKDGREIEIAQANYLSSVQVTCTTPPRILASVQSNVSVFVSLAVANDGVTYSGSVYGVPGRDGTQQGAQDANTVWAGTVVEYEYVPDTDLGSIDSIWPSTGPSVGGTLVTVYGRKIYSGWNLKCRFVGTSATISTGLQSTDYTNATAKSETLAVCETLPLQSGVNATQVGNVYIKLNAHSYSATQDYPATSSSTTLFTYSDAFPNPIGFRAPTTIPTLCSRADANETFTFGICRKMSSISDTPSRFAARSPVTGNTELTIIGYNFLPSKYLACGFGPSHAVWDFESNKANSDIVKRVPAIWDSKNQIRCTTPAMDPDSSKDCTVQANCLGTLMRVTNDGTNWSPVPGPQAAPGGSTASSVNVASETAVQVTQQNASNGLPFVYLGANGLYYPNHWKNDPNYLVLFSDINVSPYGHDSTGDGTASKPFRTIQRAIDMANPDDRIYVRRGRYTGLGNIGLRSYGKKLQLYGDGLTQSVIDCEHSNIGFIVDVPYFGSSDPYVGVINYKDIAVVGCDAQKLWN